MDLPIRTRYVAMFAVLAFLSTAIAPQAQIVPTASSPTQRDGGERILTFTEGRQPVDNPERGFSWPVDLLSHDSFAQARSRHNVTLIRSNGRLDAYRSQDLPEQVLATIDARLASAHAAGVKLILRFAYNDGPHPNPEPDASLAWIKRHIEQLKPVLHKHVDVIAWMEAGFIGAWGEWHGSTNGLDRDLGAKREVMHALLAALPVTRSVQLRNPADMLALYGSPLTGSNAHNGSDKSRTGHHNDCFLASENDSGTYGRGQRSIAQDKALVAAHGRFTPIGGETCALNPPRSDCGTALAEMTQLGFTELNLAYHPGVLDTWRSGGCFDAIRERLGYRLSLEQLSLPDRLVRGADARIAIKIKNTGFAAPMIARPLYLVLDGPARRLFKLPFDPRNWSPSRTHVIEMMAAIPADIPPGHYSLSLWMPDEAPALRKNPRYAIQLASPGVWQAASGFNQMIDQLAVN